MLGFQMPRALGCRAFRRVRTRRRLVGGLRMQDVEAGARATVEISEALLARLEGLTEAYEHSLQVIMG